MQRSVLHVALLFRGPMHQDLGPGSAEQRKERCAASGTRSSPDHNPRLGSQPLQQPQHRGLGHRNASGGRPKILTRQMQEDRAAASGDARRKIVINLDDEIVEMVIAREPIAATVPIEPHRPVVAAAAGVLAPGVFRADGANRQECSRSRVAVGAPPYPPWPKRTLRGPAIAFALIGPDAATSQRDRYDLPANRQPTPPRVAGGRSNPDRRYRAIGPALAISS